MEFLISFAKDIILAITGSLALAAALAAAALKVLK